MGEAVTTGKAAFISGHGRCVVTGVLAWPSDFGLLRPSLILGPCFTPFVCLQLILLVAITNPVCCYPSCNLTAFLLSMLMSGLIQLSSQYSWSYAGFLHYPS